MPGFLYTTYRKNDSLIIAAKASLCRFTGYRIDADPILPSQTNIPLGSRRPDPLTGIFDTITSALGGHIGNVAWSVALVL